MTNTDNSDLELTGSRGRIVARRWQPETPRFLVLLAHGYGEHTGRYDHVARRLADEGAVVLAPDHHGHGRSEGEPALVDDVGAIVADLEAVAALMRSEHPGLPLALIGHSMGGLLATRLVQTTGQPPGALVLSGPAIGGNPEIEALLQLDPIPDVPIDPAVLSRDEAVGRAYAEDPLVYHGPFQRATLEALFAAVEAIGSGPGFGDLPVLWIHGEEDELIPLRPTREAIDRLRGPATEERIYSGARHEAFNEINRDEVLGGVVAFLRRAFRS